jgi:hypothetical protein
MLFSAIPLQPCWVTKALVIILMMDLVYFIIFSPYILWGLSKSPSCEENKMAR